MKKALVTLLLVFHAFLATEAAAAPCVTASLTAYLSLGSGGCAINNLLFSDFSLNGLSDGARDFPGIVVSPDGGGANVGLRFAFTAGASEGSSRNSVHPDASPPNGTIYEDRIGFKVTGSAVTLTAATITLNGAGATGDGNVSTVQDLCLGGTFVDPALASCSPGSTSSSQSVVFISGVPDLTTSTAMFSPVTTLSVINDIVVDAGLPGSTAMLASLSSLFATQPRVVPEPGALLLLGAGFTALLMRRSPRRGRSGAIA